jgi:hypothetical protein
VRSGLAVRSGATSLNLFALQDLLRGKQGGSRFELQNDQVSWRLSRLANARGSRDDSAPAYQTRIKVDTKQRQRGTDRQIDQTSRKKSST